MITWGIYLLEVSLCLSIFYALYLIFFRNNTFFSINRWYLVSTIILSFLIPVLNFPVFTEANVIPVQYISENPITQSLNTIVTPLAVTESVTWNYVSIFCTLYVAGMAFMFIRLLRSVSGILRIKKAAKIDREGNFKIVKTDLPQSFSFFNLIFIPRDESDRAILEHEKVHVKQYHWLDLILVEAAALILWFNPILIFYRSAIKLQHEYLADAATLDKGVDFELYVNCLLTQSQAKPFAAPASPFFSTSIKKRIVMMTRRKTSLSLSTLYLTVIPVTVMLLMAFADRPTAPVIKTTFVPAPYPFTVLADDYRPSLIPLDIEKVHRIALYGGLRNWISNRIEFNTGVDFIVAKSTDVIATASGVVIESRNDPEKGNLLIIRHGPVYLTQYSNLKDVTVRAGETIKVGQVIGTTGLTPTKDEYVLRYEVFQNGEKADPQQYMPEIKLKGC